MNKLLLGLIFISTVSFAQELKLQKATKQTINAGASPTSTTNHVLELKKSKKCTFTIDSVVNVYTQKAIAFTVFKLADATVLAPGNPVVCSNQLKGKGVFQIHFASMKNRGGGRPGSPPMNLVVPIADFTQGAIVYYRVGRKKKQLIVESFEELETINAP